MIKHHIKQWLILIVCSFFYGSSFAITIQTWKSTHGVPVYFVKRAEVPVVDIAVVFDAGSARDDSHWGIASFTAAMLDEGTKNKSSAEIAREFDQVGAKMDASADRDMAVVRLRSMTNSKYLTPALNLFTDLLSHANFPESSFVRVKQQAMDAIRQNLQDPSQVGQDALFQTLYGNQPYGHPIAGTLTTVNALTREQVVSFYQHYYVNENAKIILVGAITRSQAEMFAQEIASGLLNGKAPKTLSPMIQSDKGKKLFIAMPVSQNSIWIGQNAINRDDPDFYNLLVANHVLGGLPMTSLLFDEVRNKQGFAYSVYSGFLPLEAKGPFVISLQTRVAMSNQALSIVESTVDQFLQKGPTQEQIKAAKLNLIGSFPLRMASNRGVLTQVINIAFYHLPLNYLDIYPEKINAVTEIGAKQAFSRLVQRSKFNTVIVGGK